MKFFVSRDFYDNIYILNYCPYSNKDVCNDYEIKSIAYYYPYHLGGNPWQETILEQDLKEKFRIKNLPKGTVLNLVTGESIPYEDLLPIENWEKQIYYEFGID